VTEDREQPERTENGDLPAQRGVIDSLEEGWALIALDDGQRLDWPRDRLPRDASAGMVVELTLHPPDVPGVLPEEGAWEGSVEALERGLCLQTAVRLGKQALHWPAMGRFVPDERVIVRMELDPEATDRRRKQVEDLVDDLFG
jgi:hypothetical protein